MRAIQDILKYKLIFKKCNREASITGDLLTETEVYKSKELDPYFIDNEDDLLDATKPLIHHINCTCMAFNFHHLEYLNTFFKILIIHINKEILTIDGGICADESLDMNDVYFFTSEKYGMLFGKPFSICLKVYNFYKHLEDDSCTAIIPAHIPFVSENCTICVTNKSNILYTSCGHMCVCSYCDSLYPINKCPLCRSYTANKFYLRQC